MPFASSPRSMRTAKTSKKQQSRMRRAILIFAVLLGLFLVGTVIVLSTVSYYFGVPTEAYLTETEVPWRPSDAIPLLKSDEEIQAAGEAVGDVAWRRETQDESAAAASASLQPSADAGMADSAPVSLWDNPWGPDGRGTGGYWMRSGWNGTVQETKSWDRLYNVSVREGEKIPRIIHQTWKSDTLPEKWRKAWRECREGMPDYEYMLWTDEVSRDFVATHYPDQLSMFDSYKYPIQRADSIRYIILHHFGGIYMDLDIGCRRRMDLLLQGDWEVLLPITKPVGVSNDLIFSSKGSAFMDDTVRGLKSFDHNYVSNYPTVMFSTGPMFLSAQYSIYTASHPVTISNPRAQVRVLPKALYGKNAPEALVPHSFFSHFYGSSWHSDDAGFITFLGKWGKNLMYLGVAVLIFLGARLIWQKSCKSSSRGSQQYQLLPVLGNIPESGRTSPTSSFGSGPLSPTFETPPDIGGALRRAGNILLAAPAALVSSDRRRQRGWLYFAPAMFQPAQPAGRRRTASEASQLPHRRQRDVGAAPPVPSPPPYDHVTEYADEAMDEVDEFLKRNDPPAWAKDRV